jgi:predicted ATPase
MRHTLAQTAIADGGPDSAVRDLKKRLIEQRLVSIVGPAGIGKTAVAFAGAHDMLPELAGAVQFLDFATIENPQFLGSALASQLGLFIVLENPLSIILAFLRERRVLLVFDGCERVIEATAALTEKIFRDAPRVQILATSRAPHDEVQHGCVRWRAGSHPAPHCGSAS